MQRSQSTLSRMVGRLESQGLVTRSVSPDDRRGVTTTLTAAGRARVRAAEVTQQRVLAETLT